MKSQKNAVCELLLSVLLGRGIKYELNGEVPIKSVLNSDDKKKVREIVTKGFYEGTIAMSDEAKKKYIGKGKETEMSKYVHGLVNNWIKKNPEFNGGDKYIPENPGSRTGSGDEQIKAMRNLKKTTNDPEVLREIDEAIAERLAEIKPESVVEINVDALPEHLRRFVVTE